jgi:hypothetical protein
LRDENTREQLKRIKEAKGWMKWFLALDDRHYTTEWGDKIWNLLDWLNTQQTCTFEPEAMHNLLSFGMQMAKAVRDGNSTLLRNWADAIDEWHKHKCNPDPLRAEIIAYTAFHGSNAELEKPLSKRTFQVKDIVAHLKSKHMDKGVHTARIVYRICKELGIRIHGTPGHPKTSAK